ncbi:VWA domain-containing protein [Horticoccus sp. 23ND18S-11]|uniref:VWA domain-containing protein n=1 Tax=Horticoccus sp. 23ND18S-11 TaxID=3391832 RepID=UPI0039C8CC32
MKSNPAKLERVRERWEAAWPAALAAWSKFTRLRLPRLCLTPDEATDEGLTGSFAMIRLVDQAIVVSLPSVVQSGIEDYAVEVLAHEIGHHVLAPATLTDHARTLARMRRGLPTVENQAPMVANLYTDLLINDRLQRGAGLRIADIYRAIAREGGGGAVWTLYIRIYEIMWGLERGSLGGGATNDQLEGDAVVGARLVRSFARDWLDGAGRFASLLLPYLLQDQKSQKLIARLLDTGNAGKGGDPAGLTEVDANEADGVVHPAEDPEMSGEASETNESSPAPGRRDRPVDTARNVGSHGQAREPFQYGEILRASGVDLSDHEAAVRYYRERARPQLVPFPTRSAPQATDPLPEGLEPWDIGDAPDAADWIQSVLQSPHVIPGVTTVQRVWGTSEGAEPEREPIDLDLYVDCSGSMPNPQRLVSYLTLAGAILCLSALRAGARVQATLWSGKHEVTSTPGFVREEVAILRVLTGYFGGGTAFPIHVLRDTYAGRTRSDRAVHVLVISDDGVTTMFDRDERGNSGWDVAAMALGQARGGGTLVLNLPENWSAVTTAGHAYARIAQARDEMGWNVHAVSSWPDLVKFARDFSRRKFGDLDGERERGQIVRQAATHAGGTSARP